jgi:ABC-2 type transport system ATP-binding protein
MIVADRLTKHFSAFTAIEEVSFRIEKGEVVGFLGPNGAGKSTTMRILAGVFPPSSGRVTIAGHDVAGEPLRARAVVGYLPERSPLYLDMTTRAYLNYVARMKGVSSSRCRDEVDTAIDRCALRPVAERIVGSLSKGFRQRVGIAQALVGDPQVLILDEPTVGLDPEQVADMRALVRELGRDRTVILSTHILPEVEATCDRVIIIRRGRVVAVDTPANLNRRLRRGAQIWVEVNGPADLVAAHLKALPGVDRVESHPDTTDGCALLTVTTSRSVDLRENIADAIASRGWGLRELRPLALTLEEIFLTMVHDSPPPGDPHEDLDHLPA